MTLTTKTRQWFIGRFEPGTGTRYIHTNHHYLISLFGFGVASLWRKR